MKEIDEGGQSSFGDYMLPLMTLTLKQGFGRLIRRASDTGVVAILDDRLTSKEYGRRSRNDLPPARFSREFKEVHRADAVQWHTEPRQGVEEHADGDGVDQHPVGQLPHRPAPVKVVVIHDNAGGLLEVGHL